MPPLSDSLNLYFALCNNYLHVAFFCLFCVLSCNYIVCYLQGTAEKQSVWLMLFFPV